MLGSAFICRAPSPTEERVGAGLRAPGAGGEVAGRGFETLAAFAPHLSISVRLCCCCLACWRGQQRVPLGQDKRQAPGPFVHGAFSPYQLLPLFPPCLCPLGCGVTSSRAPCKLGTCSKSLILSVKPMQMVHYPSSCLSTCRSKSDFTDLLLGKAGQTGRGAVFAPTALYTPGSS